MAATGQEMRGRSSAEFVDDTILEAFVPAASRVNVQELLEAWDGEVLEDKNTIVPFIEQRQFLLLDEEVPVHIVLRTKLLDEDVLEAYLARLAISLEARAYGTIHTRPVDHQQQQHEKPTTANELLWTGTIPSDDEPTICATEVQTEAQDEPNQFVYIFWKINVPISRPKAKINKLSIYFTPSASLKPIQPTKAKVSVDDEYLPSMQPQPVNLLAAFAGDPALRGVRPKLLASNPYRPPGSAGPSTSSLQRGLRSGSRRLFRAAPAFLWRLRFISSPAPADVGTTIAALDLEITPFANSPVRLDSVHLDLGAGQVEELTPVLPKTCSPGDQLTLLYKLRPGKREDLGSNLPTLKVIANGSVLVSEACIPTLSFSYSTPVDLPTASRPVSRAGPVAATTSPRKEPPPTKPIGPDSLIPISDLPNTTPSASPAPPGASVGSNLIISITGPPTVTVNKTFIWSLFMINKSEKVQRLALVAITKRRPWPGHRPQTSRGSLDHKTGEVKQTPLAEAVIDDRLLYERQKGAVQDPTGLICLSPDVRIGPLAPGACFTAEMKFVALMGGVQNLEALRVVDLTTQTQDAVDVRYLPDIVAVEQDESSDSGSE